MVRPDRLEPTHKIGEDKLPGGSTEGSPASSRGGGHSFESYMEKAATKPGSSTQSPTVSPFDLVQGQTPLMKGPTLDSLLAQVKSAHGMLGDINNDLQTKNLKLKPSERHLLRSKLQNANTYLRAANTDLGVEPSPPTPAKGGILGKFLGYISEGQGNLAAAQQQLLALGKKGDRVNPADFLAIQLKIAHAQQEIEYASIMLSNAVSAMKTLFNIQL